MELNELGYKSPTSGPLLRGFFLNRGGKRILKYRHESEVNVCPFIYLSVCCLEYIRIRLYVLSIHSKTQKIINIW